MCEVNYICENCGKKRIGERKKAPRGYRVIWDQLWFPILVFCTVKCMDEKREDNIRRRRFID